jgi:hypothetical protein
VPKLEVEDLKRLREALCVAQSAIGQAYSFNPNSSYVKNKIDTIQKVLDQIDILRPLGPDGKHGDRHTENCGCELVWRKVEEFEGYEVAPSGHLRVIGDEEWYTPTIAIPNGPKYYNIYEFGSEILVPVEELVRKAFPERYIKDI